MSKKIIGIVGGMGPEATADLFMKVIKCTPVEKDQDHIRVIIDSNTNIPDRTKAILGVGPDPVQDMQESVDKLTTAGAEILIMPCNTAHYFYSQLNTGETVTFLHMMNETVKYIKEKYPHMKNIGVLATTGTLQSKLYHQALERENLVCLTPQQEDQQKVMDAIYATWGIKAGYYDRARCLLTEVGESLVQQGAEAVILGCTEIPLVIEEKALSVPAVDATVVLAQAAVKKAL